MHIYHANHPCIYIYISDPNSSWSEKNVNVISIPLFHTIFTVVLLIRDKIHPKKNIKLINVEKDINSNESINSNKGIKAVLKPNLWCYKIQATLKMAYWDDRTLT